MVQYIFLLQITHKFGASQKDLSEKIQRKAQRRKKSKCTTDYITDSKRTSWIKEQTIDGDILMSNEHVKEGLGSVRIDSR